MPSWFWPAICCWLVVFGAYVVALLISGARAAALRAQIIRTSNTPGGNR